MLNTTFRLLSWACSSRSYKTTMNGRGIHIINTLEEFNKTYGRSFLPLISFVFFSNLKKSQKKISNSIRLHWRNFIYKDDKYITHLAFYTRSTTWTTVTQPYAKLIAWTQMKEWDAFLELITQFSTAYQEYPQIAYSSPTTVIPSKRLLPLPFWETTQNWIEKISP